MAYGLQLHSMSGKHYYGFRNKCNFILLPDKRTLFFLSENDKLPLDCFYSNKETSAHVMVAKRIVHYFSCYAIDEFTTKEIAHCKNDGSALR